MIHRPAVALVPTIVFLILAQPAAAQIGRAALGGALIGAIAGGGRGAAIGALVGAGTGALIASQGRRSSVLPLTSAAPLVPVAYFRSFF
jgi:hypothetical protein